MSSDLWRRGWSSRSVWPSCSCLSQMTPWRQWPLAADPGPSGPRPPAAAAAAAADNDCRVSKRKRFSGNLSGLRSRETVGMEGMRKHRSPIASSSSCFSPDDVAVVTTAFASVVWINVNAYVTTIYMAPLLVTPEFNEIWRQCRDKREREWERENHSHNICIKSESFPLWQTIMLHVSTFRGNCRSQNASDIMRHDINFKTMTRNYYACTT